jgi:bacterioferritin
MSEPVLSPPSRHLRGGVPALSDTATLRARARASLADGAVTVGYGADRPAVIELLNRSLATELVCVLRYKRHAFTAKGLAAEPVAAEFWKHAAEELAHADLLAARVSQLGGTPDFSPTGLASRSHAEYDDALELRDMIRADLVAERIAIDAYGEAIRFIGDGDPTTRRMLESILAMEEEHADDMADLLVKLGPPRG